MWRRMGRSFWGRGPMPGSIGMALIWCWIRQKRPPACPSPVPQVPPGLLRLVTEELTVVDGDVLGRIDFLAPLESSGTDAIAIAASIWAEADATFDASTNSTDLVFATGTSEAATEKMRLTHDGALVPSTTDTLSLGTSALNWSDLFLDSGAVVNFDGGDVTLTHASNLLTLAGGNVDFGDNQLIKPLLKDYGEEVNALGDLGGGTDDIDLTAGNVVSATVFNGGADIHVLQPHGLWRCLFIYPLFSPMAVHRR